MGNKINKYLKFLSLCIVIVSLIIAPSCVNLERNSNMSDYTISLIDSLIFEADDADYSTIVRIDDTHFMVAYGNGSSADGRLITFSIDEEYGNITKIDTYIFYSYVTGEHSLIQIDATHYILAFGDVISGTAGYIKTFSIDENYDNITEIDSLLFAEDGGACSLVKIDATHFILAHSGAWNVGVITTFSIDENYDNITEIYSLEHDDGRGSSNSLLMIDTTHFILAYHGGYNDGYIKTFSMDESYNITKIDVLDHDVESGADNSLVMMDATHFMLAYAGADADGFIKTFSIDKSYDNIAEIDSLEHDTASGLHNSLVKIDATHCVLAYQGSAADGYIKVFSIDESFDNITEMESVEHDAVTGEFHSLVNLVGPIFALAYNGDSDVGYIRTFAVGPIPISYDLNSSISALRSKWWLNTDIQARIPFTGFKDLNAEIICRGNYTRERYLMVRYDHVPARDEQNVKIGKAMKFRLYNPDPLFGIDLTTFKVRFNGGTWYRYGDSRLTFTEVSYTEYLVYFNPPNFTYDSGITIEVYCEDNYNNPGIKLEIL